MDNPGTRPIPPFLETSDSQINEPVPSNTLDTEDFLTYGIVPKSDRALALKVVHMNGIQFFYHYGRMGSPIMFDGEECIYIPFGKKEIKIFGDNLELVFDYLGSQRLAWIREGRSSEKMEAGEKEPFISMVQFKDI